MLYNSDIDFNAFFAVHIPVLLKETIDILSLTDGLNVLDCTFGGGGHSKAILDFCNCQLLGIDRDPAAILRAEDLKVQYNSRFEFQLLEFSNLGKLNRKFDRVLFDLGVSSFQLDEAERGFSFQKDSKLDMRMSSNGVSAYDVVNSFSEEDLAEVIKTYGEEPRAYKIASAIVNQRKLAKIETTLQLADLIHNVIGFKFNKKKYSKIDTATKTFQAIRIFVNDELNEINTALNALPSILNNGAIVAIISFHALEDRIIKNWGKSQKSLFSPINKDIIKAGEGEILQNQRSRSAVLRAFAYKDGLNIDNLAVGKGA